MFPEGKLALTKNDLAKYPIVTEATKHMKPLDLKIEELKDSTFDSTLDRAEKRIKEAILKGLVSAQFHDEEIEILSFPMAVMMVASTADSRLKRRYAMAEAKRFSNLLKGESKEKILEIANNFSWRIRLIEGKQPYVFALHFTDFLKRATVFHEKEWKLVNRLVLNGEIYLTKGDVARLLEEEARGHIEGKLNLEIVSLPQNITNRVEQLKNLFMAQKGTIRLEELPKDAVTHAFPPCIKSLYDGSLAGRRISHIGRFALTSFLLNIGMNVEDVVNVFRSFTDFNERVTRYQVEHIAGVRGSRTKYTPPQCDTLRTHGVCPGMEEICRTIRHPLAYYRRKTRAIKKEAPAELA